MAVVMKMVVFRNFSLLCVALTEQIPIDMWSFEAFSDDEPKDDNKNE